MDLTKLSDADLLALKAGDYSKMSDEGLKALKASSAPEPSGAIAGFEHGSEDLKRGLQETAKQYLGVGNGADAPSDPDFVPAQVINGINPLKWNYGQLPQKAAEAAPGLAESAASSIAGSKLGGVLGFKGRLLGGLIGAAAPYVLNNAGMDAKADAARRTGDANAEPNTADKVRAGLTDTAAGLVQGIGPTRFIPGSNAITSVGAAGLKAAAKKYLTTVGENAIGAAGGNLTQQVGNTIGTDKGLQVDPNQVGDAAIGGAGAAALMGAPRAVVDAHSAISQRAFGGDNANAASAYFKRLQDNAGDTGLGSSKGDFAAQENTKANLTRELQDVDHSGMDQDTANTLALARSGKPITEDHVQQIEQADPQAGFLARQLYVAQQAEKFGSFDRANKAWSGGMSGFADKYAVRPFKSHLLIGGASALSGAHMLGSYALPTLAGAAGVYGAARALDNLTGMRSPAKGLATRFVDENVPTRLPPPPVPAPEPQPDLTQGPWGQRPPSPTSVPQVAQTPPAPPKPPINPIALKMALANAKATTKAANEPEPVAPEPATEAPQISPVALKMALANVKATTAAANAPAPAAPPAPSIPPVHKLVPQQLQVNPLRLPTDVTAPAKNLMKGLALAQSLRTPPTKITKSSNGTVQVKATAAPQVAPAPEAAKPWEQLGAFSPIPEDQMAFKGVAPAVIAKMIRDGLPEGMPELKKLSYQNKAVQTHTARDAAIAHLINEHPEAEGVLQQLLDQLHEPGNSDINHSRRAIKHYTNLLSGETRDAVRSHFDRKDVQDAIWPKPEPKKATKKNDKAPEAS